jgi:hypothetical protein
MHELTEEERRYVTRALRDVIDGDRFILSERVKALKSALRSWRAARRRSAHRCPRRCRQAEATGAAEAPVGVPCRGQG